MKRYNVCVIVVGDLGTWQVGQSLFSTDDANEAKVVAQDMGNGYTLGSCIWDSTTNTTDWGDSVTSGRVRR